MSTMEKCVHYGTAKITGGADASVSLLYRQQII